MAETMRDLKRRMKSVESTEHITNAMRLVSAAKFRRAKALYDRKSQQLQEVSDTIEGIFYMTAGVWVIIVMLIAFGVIVLMNLISGRKMKNIKRW